MGIVAPSGLINDAVCAGALFLKCSWFGSFLLHLPFWSQGHDSPVHAHFRFGCYSRDQAFHCIAGFCLQLALAPVRHGVGDVNWSFPVPQQLRLHALFFRILWTQKHIVPSFCAFWHELANWSAPVPHWFSASSGRTNISCPSCNGIYIWLPGQNTAVQEVPSIVISWPICISTILWREGISSKSFSSLGCLRQDYDCVGTKPRSSFWPLSASYNPESNNDHPTLGWHNVCDDARTSPGGIYTCKKSF